MSTTLQSTLRDKKGSNYSKQLRKEGQIPGVVYGLKQDPISVTVSEKHLEKLFKNDLGENIIFELTIDQDGKESKERVKTYNLERDALSRRIISVDFIRVNDETTVKSTVPVRIVGNCPGLKMGGVLVQKVREVKLESLPTNIPQYIDVDISNVGLGEFVRIKDLPATDKYSILTNGMESILKIIVPRAASGAGATDDSEESTEESEQSSESEN